MHSTSVEDLEPTNKITELHFELKSDDAQKQIDLWRNQRQAVNRDSWHIYFLLQAYLVSTRSLDPQTQCGCVLIRDKTIIGSGYNSFVRNIKDNVLPNLRPDKYPFMIHSEHNAILNCARNGISCLGATAYVTGPPCCDCLQFMYQAGISSIFFANNNHAHMTQNKEYEVRFEVLSYLMQKIRIYAMDLDKTTLQKIENIKKGVL